MIETITGGGTVVQVLSLVLLVDRAEKIVSWGAQRVLIAGAALEVRAEHLVALGEDGDLFWSSRTSWFGRIPNTV